VPVLAIPFNHALPRLHDIEAISHDIVKWLIFPNDGKTLKISTKSSKCARHVRSCEHPCMYIEHISNKNRYSGSFYGKDPILKHFNFF
jgi:hypothetical protein